MERIAGWRPRFWQREASKLREREEDDRRRAVFLEARRLVTWHYHWIIVNEFLPQIIGAVTRERHPLAWTTVLYSAAGPAEHSGGVPGRRISLRTQPGEAVVPRESRRRRRPSVLWVHLRSGRRESDWTLLICAAAHGRPDASSGGRRSSILAAISRRTCGRPRSSTRRSRARCSICRLGRLRAETDRPRSPSGTCFAT